MEILVVVDSARFWGVDMMEGDKMERSEVFVSGGGATRTYLWRSDGDLELVEI